MLLRPSFLIYSFLITREGGVLSSGGRAILGQLQGNVQASAADPLQHILEYLQTSRVSTASQCRIHPRPW